MSETKKPEKKAPAKAAAKPVTPKKALEKAKKTTEYLSGLEAHASLKLVKTSPRKLALVADLIRGTKASNALLQLEFCPKRIAGVVKTLLASCIANAENNHNMDIDTLVVDKILVGKAYNIRRFRPRAKGRAAPINKYFSNISITLREAKFAN